MNDEIDESVDDSNQVGSSLLAALTDRHNMPALSSVGGVFSLEASTDSPFESRRDEGLTPSQVAKFLCSELVPWSVDCLDISFPVVRVNTDPPEPWYEQLSNGRDWTRKWETKIAVGEGEATLVVKRRSSGTTGFVQFNPTTCLYGPKSLYITPLEDALFVVHQVLDAVDQWVQVGCSRNEIRLSRIDLNKTPEPVSDVQRLLTLVRDAPARGKAAEVRYGHRGRRP